jgi:flagellar biosynthetic protein FlhB
MSKQEIKDEMKESEGRPEVKMQRRQIARKLAFSRQMDDIPTADVVVTNPTHYSIAIKYNSTDNAPIIVAMGTDMLALKIRTIARQYDVIIVESPPLARSLYYFSNIGEEIHPGLYDAVAKLLSYIYKLKNFNEFGGNEPMLDSIEIDKELRK